MANEEQVYYGFDTIDASEKATKVNHVFERVAHRYDMMNDISSLGLHRIWKDMAVDALKLGTKHDRITHILDVAAGTGDMSQCIAKRYKDNVRLTLCDPNADMLDVARKKHMTQSYAKQWQYCESIAERLPFNDKSFDAVIISFGLRNCTYPKKALAEFSRVLRPMGRLVCLEFSMPQHSLIKQLYDQYSFRYLPVLGSVVTGDAEPYRYLAQSIRTFMSPQDVMQAMKDEGFSTPKHVPIEQGIVSLYTAYNISHKKR